MKPNRVFTPTDPRVLPRAVLSLTPTTTQIPIELEGEGGGGIWIWIGIGIGGEIEVEAEAEAEVGIKTKTKTKTEVVGEAETWNNGKSVGPQKHLLLSHQESPQPQILLCHLRLQGQQPPQVQPKQTSQGNP